MSTFSPNLNIEEVARNADVGVWDTPTNNNWTLMDSAIGAIATVSLNNANIVLSPSQFQSKGITLNSTLTGNVQVTLPTSFSKTYEIRNSCTGSSAFTITLATTAAGGQQVCAPPGESITIVNDGVNLYFHNLGRIGEYWDYAGSSVPAWVSGCTIPPYANCDGTAISSLHTLLPIILGSSLLPNSKGKARFALDQGAGLISSAATGFSGSLVGATGGAQTTTLVTGNLPAYTPSGSIAVSGGTFGGSDPGGASIGTGGATATVKNNVAIAAAFTGNAQGGTSTPMTNLPPAYIGGLTLIRAA